MITPVKAAPGEPGKVFLFGDESRSTKKEGIDSAVGIAQNFTLTDLPIEEGGYAEHPSVLIILNMENVSPELFDQINLHKQVYGTNEQVSGDHYQFPLVEEEWFLNNIRLSDNHGINFFTKFHEHIEKSSGRKARSDEYVNRIMELAKKHFDITFIVMYEGYSFLKQFSDLDKRILITSELSTVKRFKEEESTMPVFRTDRHEDPRKMSSPVKGSSGLFLLDDSMVENKPLSLALEQRVSRRLIIPDEKSFNYPSLKKSEKKGRLPSSDTLLPFLILAPFAPFALFTSAFLESLDAILIAGSMVAIPSIYAVTGAEILKSTRREKTIKTYLDRVQLSIETEGQPKYYPLGEPVIKNITHEDTKVNSIPIQKGSDSSNGNNGSGDSRPINKAELFRRIEKLQDKWVEYELNPLKLLEYPLMSDVTCEETLSFYQTYESLVEAQRSYEEKNIKLNELQTVFSQAEKAFIKAEHNAQREKHSSLTNEQRGKVRIARKLVSIALSEESSPNERIIAWEKANDQLEGIIHLPDTAVKGLLEARVGV